MLRLGLFNMLIGFCLLLLAASAGAFVALDATHRFLEGTTTQTWRTMLEASGHGHTALFGVIQVLFGLTLPYSSVSPFQKKIQSIFLLCGALAMGPGMMARAALGPTATVEWNGILLGGLLSLWMVGLSWHTFGIADKILRRA